MGIAIAVLLVAVPLILMALAARPPTVAALRRLTVSVLGDRFDGPVETLIGPVVRRRRVWGAVGAGVGLWATATWHSTTWSWDGVLSWFAPPLSDAGSGWWYAVVGRSFVVTVNVFGILIGFAAGLLLAEWTARPARRGARRAALLTARVPASYLPRWMHTAVALAAGSAVAAFVAAPLIPETLKTGYSEGELSPWWAVVLIGTAVASLATRAAVLASTSRATGPADLAAKEITRALTAATMTIIALAAFTGATASSLARMSAWFGWGWGDGLSTGAITLSLLTWGFAIAAFVTPYWAMVGHVDVGPETATP